MQKYQNENREESEPVYIWITVIKLIISWRENSKTYAWNVMDFINGGNLWLESRAETCFLALPVKTQSLPLADSVGECGRPYFPVYVFPILACL